MIFGVSSMTAPLLKVMLKKPGPSLRNANCSKWHYSEHFHPKKIDEIHQLLVHVLEEAGCEIYWMEGDDKGNADAVFTYDASLMTRAGAILMSPGKILRAGEQELHRQFYAAHDIPILGEIEGNATAEAGDTLWLDDKTLIIGRGFRTNTCGAEQIMSLVAPLGIDCHIFDLPCYHGSDSCLHLMSLISMVDTRTALIYQPLLPVGLLRLLIERNIGLISAPDREFEESNTLSTNVLALSPGHCLMLADLPETRYVLTDAGIHVSIIDAASLCVGCEGGQRCLTRPLLRA